MLLDLNKSKDIEIKVTALDKHSIEVEIKLLSTYSSYTKTIFLDHKLDGDILNKIHEQYPNSTIQVRFPYGIGGIDVEL